MGLIVEHQDVLEPHKRRHHRGSSGFGLQGLQRFTPAWRSRESLSKLQALAKLESVIVGDDDLGAFQIAEHILRHQFASGIVTVGSFAEARAAVADVRLGNYQKSAVNLALPAAHGVDGLPGDQHSITVVLPARLPVSK